MPILKQTLFLTVAAVLLATTGCANWSRDLKKATGVAVVDAQPSAASKGYVDFYTSTTNFPVPVFILDDRGKAIQLGSVGLRSGSYYSVGRNGNVVAEKLRVALPAGKHTFMVENNGQIVQIPVTAGNVTPVEIDYTMLDHAAQYVVYRLDTRVFKANPNQSGEIKSPGPVALKTN